MGTYETTMLKLEKMAQANTATQMNWQKMMSDTSHQREVEDLIAAGLNPVLSSGGSGAQSYTTSVDSAVNGIAGMASAREGANATRYAAQQSAAATRAAAAAQIEAARIAAGASERNNIRSTGITPIGAAKDAFTKAFSAISDNKLKMNILSQVRKDATSMSDHPERFLINLDLTGKKRFQYSNFNHDAKALANNACRKIGIPSTDKNRLTYLKMCMGDQSATNLWASYVQTYERRNTNARSQWSRRSGSGAW